MAITEKEPKYGVKRVTLRGRQPLIFELPFACDFLTFIDLSEVNPDKIYVAFNTPLTYIQVSRVIVAQLPTLALNKVLFRWDLDQTGKSLTFYYAGAPTVRIGVTTVTIGGDFIGLARETTLSAIKNTLGTRASESTLSTLNAKIQSQSAGLFVKDLSVGVSPTQVDTDSAYRDEVIILADSANTDVVYVGDSANQLFPLETGASVAVRKTALNLIYVRAASGTQSVHIISGGA